MSSVNAVPDPIARFFPGYIPEGAADDFPIYPLDAPGMPSPGPDFIAESVRLGDILPTVKWKKPQLLEYLLERLCPEDGQTEEEFQKALKKTRREDLLGKAMAMSYPGSYLETLHRAALYRTDFHLPVVVDRKPTNVRFLPGHLWNPADAGTGPKPADVMIIGKHPGREEMEQNANFCGVATDELLRAFDELTVTESEMNAWYVTNIVKHPNLDRSKDAIPADWIRNCLPLFHQELRLVKPRFLLCLGAEATKAVLGRGVKMTDTVGRVFDVAVPVLAAPGSNEFVDHKIKVICAAHPARISRDPELYDTPVFLGSLRLFAGLVHGVRNGLEEEGLERRYVRTNQQLVDLIADVMEETKDGIAAALDAEWDGERATEPEAYLRTIQFSHRHKFGAAIVLRLTGGAVNPELDQEVVVRELSRLLTPTQKRPVRIIGHNLKADLPWLARQGLDLRAQFLPPLNDPNPDGINRLFSWQKTKFEGGFDTMLAAHAHSEVGPFKLEVLGAHHLGTPRYDAPLQQWKKTYCKELGIKEDALTGYGNIDEEILLPYSAYDACLTYRLYELYNGTAEKPGLLDLDRYGNNCREAFWVSQAATVAFMEVENIGLPVDKARVEEIIEAFQDTRDRFLEEFRSLLNWPDFNHESLYHRCEALFGEELNGKKDKEGNPVRVRPEGARSLYLTPVTTTDGRAWGEGGSGNLSTDKEALGILAAKSKEAKLLRNIRLISQALKTALRPGETTKNEQGEEATTYEKGLLHYVSPTDGRIRTRTYPVETGRISSSSYNLQNISSKREADYKNWLGERYHHKLRSVICAPPGMVFIESDFSTAELSILAWASGDPAMTDHCARSMLPEDDPRYYEILSSLAVTTFQLKCAPTKAAIEAAGFKHLRTAAKNRCYGLAYGQSDTGAWNKCKEEGCDVTLDEIRAVSDGIFSSYPRLKLFLDHCRERVSKPGWMCNPFGRFRRFPPTTDRQRLAELERQALNFIPQSSVADMMSLALHNLLRYRIDHRDVKFDIALQIHDAVLLIVPAAQAVRVYEEVLPQCMESVAFHPCTLDGKPRGGESYRLGIGRDLYLRWGEPLTKPQALELGIPEKYGKGA